MFCKCLAEFALYIILIEIYPPLLVDLSNASWCIFLIVFLADYKEDCIFEKPSNDALILVI